MSKLHVHMHKPRQDGGSQEQPIPDWAPFAVPSDEVWRDLQRRRNLIKMVRALSATARDEGYMTSASVLEETASRLALTLIDQSMQLQAQATKPTAASRSFPAHLNTTGRIKAAPAAPSALVQRQLPGRAARRAKPLQVPSTMPVHSLTVADAAPRAESSP